MNNVDQNAYLPIAEQIAAVCQEVQAIWNWREERRRHQWAIPPPITVLGVSGIGKGWNIAPPTAMLKTPVRRQSPPTGQ